MATQNYVVLIKDAMIDHIGISVSSYTTSKEFYIKALSPIGYELLMEVYGNAGFGRKSPAGPLATFWIKEGENHSPIHFAFTVETREEVDAFHTAALEAGGKDNGAPGIREMYHPNYYGAFIKDPDGNNIEAVCHHNPLGNAKETTESFVEAFNTHNYDAIGAFFTENSEFWITDKNGGVFLEKGKDAIMENFKKMEIDKVRPTIEITQYLPLSQNEGFFMVEVHATKGETKLQNHAAYLTRVQNNTFAEIKMVEALPRGSNAFWKS